MRILSKVSFALIIISCITGLRGQEVGPQIALSAGVAKEITVIEDGKEIIERVPVETVTRGDTLVYTVAYRNQGGEPASGTSIVNPVPEGTTYILESAGGKDAEITYSIDGGNYFQKPPVTYQVKRDDGTTVNEPADADMYTHIRWVIQKPIPAGSSGEVEFKVKVN